MVESKEKCKREEKSLKADERERGGEGGMPDHARSPPCHSLPSTRQATIEKGMPDSEQITFKYESEQKPGQIPGDVVFKLKPVGRDGEIWGDYG